MSGSEQPVVEAARTHARDLYLSALLAPAPAQEDLLVLAAYLGEIRRIPLTVHDAAMGEIRLQWWREALDTASDRIGNPVADAVLDLKRRRALRADLLAAPLEGISRELYEDGIQDERELALYADETDGAPIRLALAVLGGERDRDAERLVEPAGRALALTRLALTLPQLLALGRLPLRAAIPEGSRDPRSLEPAEAREATRVLLQGLAEDAGRALAEFRSGQVRLDAGLFTAFLPVSLVAPYLKSVLAPGRDVLSEVADISPLSRVMRLWFAHWRGRI
jgi:phytoene synthase